MVLGAQCELKPSILHTAHCNTRNSLNFVTDAVEGQGGDEDVRTSTRTSAGLLDLDFLDLDLDLGLLDFLAWAGPGALPGLLRVFGGMLRAVVSGTSVALLPACITTPDQ